MKKRIWLSPPHMGGTEMSFIGEAIDSNWVAPLGHNVDAFEKKIAEYCKVDHVLAVNSGTSAIHLALMVLGVKQGDEVIASSFTFSATVNPIVYLCAKPILVDSEPDTWNMSPDLLETAIKDRLRQGKKPKAIIAVHLYGMPANMKRINEIAARYEIPIVEDTAEALGSRFDGKPLGSFGEISILSFNGNKIITTSGGGALVSKDEELVQRACYLATQARDNANHYQHSQIGYNYRMSNILAGIGLGQMEVLEDRIEKRRGNFKFYKRHLEEYEGISFLNEPDFRYFSNYWLTTIIIDPVKCGITREEMRSIFEKENIETRPLWKPMQLQPVFSACPTYSNGVSEQLFKDGLCLPSGSNLTDMDRERIIEILTDNLKK